MSVVEERRAEATTRKRSDVTRRASLGLDRRVLVAHPGDRVGLSIRINGSPGHVVGREVKGIPPSVAEVTIGPPRSTTPCTAEITLAVSESAKPGLYPFHVVIYDYIRSQFIGEEKLGLLVLPRRLTIKDYVRLRRIYRQGG